MPIKTLHVTNAYHPTSGGISTMYRALMRAANERGRPMRLVVPGEKDAEEPVGRHGLIYLVKAPPSFAFDRRYRLLYPLRYMLPQSPIARILRHERPDVVEICDKYSLPYLGGFLRQSFIPGVPRPAVIGLSCERMDDNLRAFVSRRGWLDWLARTYLKRVYWLQYDEHVANSRYTADELVPASVGHNVPRGLHVLPMGVEIDAFDAARRTPENRAALCERAGARLDERLLLYAGRVSPEKNIPLLVDMMERLPQPYRLLVVGAGPLLDWVGEAMRERAGGRVSFLGHLRDRAALANVYANADVFVHPNPKEPFGIGPLEAMASGVALVAPDAGGVLSYASDANAWVVPPTGERFAAAVQSVFADSALRERRLRAARQTAEAFTWDRVADQFFALYDELHARHQGVVTSVPASA